MKLFLLDRLPNNDGDYWDEYYGFVIAAKSHRSARKIAQAKDGDETRRDKSFWLKKENATCKIIAQETVLKKEQIVLSHFIS